MGIIAVHVHTVASNALFSNWHDLEYVVVVNDRVRIAEDINLTGAGLPKWAVRIKVVAASDDPRGNLIADGNSTEPDEKLITPRASETASQFIAHVKQVEYMIAAGADLPKATFRTILFEFFEDSTVANPVPNRVGLKHVLFDWENRNSTLGGEKTTLLNQSNATAVCLTVNPVMSNCQDAVRMRSSKACHRRWSYRMCLTF